MANVIKSNPEFTEDESPGEVQEESQVSSPQSSEEVKVEVKPEELASEETPNKEEQGLETELVKIKGENQRSVELRQQIVEERRKRRELRKKDTEEDAVEEVDDLSDIDDESMKTIERVIKAKGFANKDEVARQTYEISHQQAENTFYASHPEYLVENDEDNVLYDALQEEVESFSKPSSAAGIAMLFEKAHSLVKQKYPSKFESKEVPTSSNRNDVAQLGGTVVGAASSEPAKTNSRVKQLTQDQVEKLRNSGWSEDDLKELINIK